MSWQQIQCSLKEQSTHISYSQVISAGSRGKSQSHPFITSILQRIGRSCSSQEPCLLYQTSFSKVMGISVDPFFCHLGRCIIQILEKKNGKSLFSQQNQVRNSGLVYQNTSKQFQPMIPRIVFNQADLWTQNYKPFSLWKQCVHSDLKAFQHF